MACKIGGREQNAGWKFVFDGQAPSLHILVQAAVALESTRMICGLREAIRSVVSRKIRILLLHGWGQGKAATRRGNVCAESVALEPRVQIIVLGSATVDAAPTRPCMTPNMARRPAARSISSPNQPLMISIAQPSAT